MDRFRPGDEVQVTGVLVQHWRRIGKPDQACEVELLINAVHVVALSTARAGSGAAKKDAPLALGMAPPPSASPSGHQPHRQEEEEEDWAQAHWRRHAETPLAGRDVIVGSLSPQVHGLYTAKLAVMLVLCGGVALRGAAPSAAASNASHQRRLGGSKAQDGGQGEQGGDHSVRGECHLLLAGDPGTGKSQLMRCAARLTHRSVVTNGRGSTNAGLTATAVISKGERAMSAGVAGGKSGKMEGGKGSEWTLEAGALVLADGGICCIDEFETMRESDRAAIHEAMEQQTLSIAKAGLVTKLRAQTAIIASTNIRKPKKASADYDPFATGFDESMVKISAPLLSRFDLVLTVRDLSWKEWDAVIADHVLDQHMSKASGSGWAREGRAGTSGEEKREGETWTQERMKEYIARVRKLTPVMTKDAEEVLKLYYQKQRQLSASEAHNRPSARTTLRMLESLVRLSQAHARLMCREQVSFFPSPEGVPARVPR